MRTVDMRSMFGLLILAFFFHRSTYSQDVNANIVEQLRPLMNVELGFVKRVCEPTDEQKQKIAAAAEKCLEEMSDIVGAKANNAFGGFGGGQPVAMAANGQQLYENPFTRIRRDLADAIRPLISEQQFANYMAESEKRDQFRREAVVSMTMELLDRHLALTDDQRSRLTERLLEKWEGAEDLTSMETYLSNPQYVPQVPEVIVQRELDEAQRRLWKSLNKYQFPIHLSNNAAGLWDEDFLE